MGHGHVGCLIGGGCHHRWQRQQQQQQNMAHSSASSFCRMHVEHWCAHACEGGVQALCVFQRGGLACAKGGNSFELVITGSLKCTHVAVIQPAAGTDSKRQENSSSDCRCA
jgi:hypothetical protein